MPIANKRMTTNRNPTRAHLLMLGFIAFSTQRKHSDKIVTAMNMYKANTLSSRRFGFQIADCFHSDARKTT